MLLRWIFSAGVFLYFCQINSVLASCIGINCQCTASSSAIAFPNYHTLSASPTNMNGNVQVTCSALIAGLNVSYTIALNAGNGGSFSPRKMSHAPYSLNYNLYTNAAYTQVWGDGTSSTSIVSDSYLLSLLSATRNYTVYGRIPALQNVGAGTYNDSILVTVTY